MRKLPSNATILLCLVRTLRTNLPSPGTAQPVPGRTCGLAAVEQQLVAGHRLLIRRAVRATWLARIDQMHGISGRYARAKAKDSLELALGPLARAETREAVARRVRP